jgi:two-component system, chemotaxis family, CheB/CheR fusion protein
MARVLPYRSIDNYIGGAVLTFVNITPLSRAQQALRESEERFRAVADLVPDLLWSSDPSGSADWFNRRWLEFTGRSIEAAQGFGWIEVVHPEDREESLRNFRSAVASGKPFVQQHRIRGKDGSHRWFLARAEPRRDEAGRIIQWLGAITDIHDQRTALDTLRDSESRTKLLLAELQHRVRNTLAVIRSIARRTATTSETVDDYAAHLDGRLDAYARVQAVVTRDPTAGIDLEQLVADELLAHAAHEGEQVTRIEGPPIRLHPKAAETMALAVHELATNAVKYGALSAEDGHVKVTWTIEKADGAPPRLVFSWNETGVKLSGEAPTRRGFGTELIERTLAYQLEAEASLRFGPDGVNCTIALPLNDVITPSDGR